MSNEIIRNEENMNGLKMYSSFEGETQEDRLRLYAAISDAMPLDDHIGDTLMVSDVVCQQVPVVDDDGEEQIRTRIVLVTPEGQAYASISKGVETSINNLFITVGQPTWEPPIPLKPVKKPGRNGYKFTSLVPVL